MTVIFGLLLLTIVVWSVFEDQLFTKKNAKELIEEQQISLQDKLEMKENRSMSAIGDYYHTFTIEVSERDKQNAILKVKGADNFKADKNLLTNRYMSLTKDILDPK